MDRHPTLAVCGLGRCGTSMMMQMLHAGGDACFGDWPDFEPDELRPGADLSNTWPMLHGTAFKLIDPHRAKPPGRPFIAILLTRDPANQALSQWKLLRASFPMLDPFDRSARRRWIANLRASEEKARTWLRRNAGFAIEITFEEVLAAPRSVAERLAALPRLPAHNLNVDAMVAAVRPRPSGAMCAPDLAIEAALIREVENRHG